MKAAVTGASGLLGGNLARELLAQGNAVTATRRSPDSTRHLDGEPIAWVQADLDDPRALAGAFAGADVVFHCAALVSILPRPTRELIATNVEGTRHVIDAVRAAGVPRLVHCSTVGAVGLSEDGRPCTEEARWHFAEDGLDDGYVTTKRRAEDVVQEALRDGLDAVTVNPTYMLGPYDVKPSSGKLIVGVVERQAPGHTTGRNNFVDVLITSVSVRWAYTERFQFSSAKAESELGYRHGPLEPAIADAIAWFRAHGILPPVDGRAA